MLNHDDFIKTPLLKRIFDIIVSLAILLVLSPILLLIFIGMLIEMAVSKTARGPLFYCEKRVSAGKEFKFCKIRTCKLSAYEDELKENGTIHTCNVEGKRKNFLIVGWLVKKIYFDEVPQLVDVLKGDLSLVGPRPKPVSEYNDLISRGDYSKKVIRCGLSGLLQSHKGNLHKFSRNLDEEYIGFCRSHSAWRILTFDIKILLRTAKVMLEHKGL